MENKAFTILEISIVTLLISVFISIIVAANSLITQANLRSIVTDLGEINKAIAGFRLQYNAWPGDVSSSVYTISSFTGNGNGNSVIESSSTACNSPESILAWNHLYYTNNYSINFSGTSGSTAPCVSLGVNVPLSKVRGGFYFLWNAAGNTGSMFGVANGNIIHFGSISSNDNSVNGSILSANDGADLDKKIDDGIANTGNFYGIDGNEVTSGLCSGQWGGGGANYNYTSTSIACRFVYLLEN